MLHLLFHAQDLIRLPPNVTIFAILPYLPSFSGPPGCEFAGELADFVAADLAPRYGERLVSFVKVTLLQSGDSLLTQFEASLQSLALNNFAKRVNVEFNARVVEVTDSEVVLKNGSRISYGILVWAAGNGTRPIVAKLVERITGEPMDEAIRKRRKLSVDPWLRVKGINDIFAMGDCSVMDGRALPATAQVAGQQGAYLGRLLSKASNIRPPTAPVLRDDETRKINPFQFLSLGAMAYLGNDRAVVQVETSPSKNLVLGGRIAFFLWRSVYAVKQVDVRNRVLVLFDWFKTKAFGRDGTYKIFERRDCFHFYLPLIANGPIPSDLLVDVVSFLCMRLFSKLLYVLALSHATLILQYRSSNCLPNRISSS